MLELIQTNFCRIFFQKYPGKAVQFCPFAPYTEEFNPIQSDAIVSQPQLGIAPSNPSMIIENNFKLKLGKRKKSINDEVFFEYS